MDRKSLIVAFEFILSAKKMFHVSLATKYHVFLEHLSTESGLSKPKILIDLLQSHPKWEEFWENWERDPSLISPLLEKLKVKGRRKEGE